jgi:hypothetical protein
VPKALNLTPGANEVSENRGRMNRLSFLASAFVVLRRDKAPQLLPPPSSSSSCSSLVLYKILIHEHEDEDEDEDEMNQIRSYAYARLFFLFSAFPPGRRHRPLWAGGRIPTSEFLTPYASHLPPATIYVVPFAMIYRSNRAAQSPPPRSGATGFHDVPRG